MAETLVHNAGELVLGPGTDGPLEIVSSGAVAIEDGTVTDAGPAETILDAYPPSAVETTIDADGGVICPGFVDAHTHAVIAGDRSDEFAQRLQGRDYQDILADGGGIHRTVRAVRNASRAELRDRLLAVLDTMLAHGATTVEVKSGYGLGVEPERRMLDAMTEADDRHPIDVIPTFLGAHAVPPETTHEAYVEEVITEQLPAVADRAEFCDVFCDEGAFTVEEAERILTAGREVGLAPKLHAEEFAHTGAAQLAADLEATSADHLLKATPADARALADAGVVPTLLPGTAFTLGTDYADAHQFQAVGAPPALASDFNPNCYCPSMTATVQFASHGMGQAPAAALRAATSRAAAAVDRADRGRLRAGAPADLVIADVPNHTHLAYRFGTNPIETVVKGGERVYG